MKLLTIGLVLGTAAVAGCSSTTAGPAGAIEDAVEMAATSPASPSASASSDPISSPDPVSPSPAPTEETASPVASPTDSPALLGGSKNCNTGLAFSCGQTGPGGGTVFYAQSTPFTLSNGYTAACSNNCQYLEVQKAQLPAMPWCVGSGATKSISPGTGAAIGTGYSNTQTMATFSGYCSSGAANAAIASTSGGYTDWFVPSQNEISAMQFYWPTPTSAACWTSSQSSAKKAYRYSAVGLNDDWSKTKSWGVCPVRAF